MITLSVLGTVNVTVSHTGFFLVAGITDIWREICLITTARDISLTYFPAVKLPAIKTPSVAVCITTKVLSGMRTSFSKTAVIT